MKLKTTLISLVVAVVGIAAISPTANAAHYDFFVGGLYYKITSSNTVMVTYQYEPSSATRGYSSDILDITGSPIRIPSSVQNNGKTYTVTAINDNTFRYCNTIEKVVIPNTVKSIGAKAFYNCTKLNDVGIDINQSQLETIKDEAFYNTAITYFAITPLVTNIGAGAFNAAKQLRVVGIMGDTHLTTIGNSAFANCISLEEFEIPSTVTSLGNGIFYACKALETVSLPDNLTKITDNMFAYTAALKSIDLPASVTSIGQDAFNKCALESIDLKSVTSIGERAFEYCNGLTSVTIPSSVTTIDALAFVGCENLASVDIQNTFLGISQFSNCKLLKNVNFGPQVTTIGIAAFSGSGLKNIVIPAQITTLENGAFHNCADLESVTIGNGVKTVANDPFGGCAKLLDLTWDNDKINMSALSATLKGQIKNVVFGENITSIPANALKDCSALKKVTIPENIESIGNSAFSGCTMLTDVISLMPRPIRIDASVFDGVEQHGYCDLHVIEGAKVRYEAMDVWKEFTIITEDAGSASSGTGVIGDVNGDGEVDVKDVTALINLILK
ncbi:MAG: leucine-rich repeat protein [Muribaculaceae bacterium]|nr:leucine-rich repeat protein [Muribaculaceae bacterium]